MPEVLGRLLLLGRAALLELLGAVEVLGVAAELEAAIGAAEAAGAETEPLRLTGVAAYLGRGDSNSGEEGRSD